MRMENPALGKAHRGISARAHDSPDGLCLSGLIDLSARLERPGFRVQGDARVGNQPRFAGGITRQGMPARHRPAARRAGPGGDAQHWGRISICPRVSGRRVTVEARRGRLTEMVVLRERGLRRGFRTAIRDSRTQSYGACCNTRAPSASPCGCTRAGTSRAAAWRTTAKSPPGSGLRESQRFAATIAFDHTAAGAHHGAPRGATCAVCHRRRRRRWCALPERGAARQQRHKRASRAPFGHRLGYFDSHCHVIRHFGPSRTAMPCARVAMDHRCAVLGSRAVDEDAKQLPFADPSRE